jgi:hypothetical protein
MAALIPALIKFLMSRSGGGGGGRGKTSEYDKNQAYWKGKNMSQDISGFAKGLGEVEPPKPVKPRSYKEVVEETINQIN